MREIKFRAWDGRAMHNAGCFSFEQVPPFPFAHDRVDVFKFAGIESGENIFEHPLENPVVMQFTGLKDKKGTEIYEGDLLSGYASPSEVFFSPYLGFGLRTKSGSWNASLSRWVDHGSKVIGNIYENPDVIK